KSGRAEIFPLASLFHLPMASNARANPTAGLLWPQRLCGRMWRDKSAVLRAWRFPRQLTTIPRPVIGPEASMWFKNLQLYRFTQPFTLDPEELDRQLALKPFTGCNSQDRISLGWTAPLNLPDAPMVHAANGCLMLCLQRQEKVLPRSEEHTSELSHVKISYAVFCLKKK